MTGERPPQQGLSSSLVTTRPPEDETLHELGAVADELLEQAAALRRRWQELGEVLGVDLEAHPPTPQRGATDDERAVTPAEPASRGGEADDVDVGVAVRSGYGAESPDPVRVMVFDMMLSGRSRKEVKEYVRTSFGSDADLAVVDELFDTR
jgi:hypothetical protein